MASSAAAAGTGAGLPGKRKCMGVPSALPSLLFLAVALAGLAAPSSAAVYKVGDSVGWTIMGSPNYTAWAASKTFRVGDTLVFEYNAQFHNVLDVIEANYGSCSTAAPRATYSTGNDSIPLRSAGHHYFLCGVPGHCSIGQKVDVNVLQASAAAPSAGSPSASSPGTSPSAGAPSASSPGTSPSTSSPPTSAPSAGGSTGTGTGEGVAPSPQRNGAAPVASVNYVMGCATAVVAVAVSLLISL